MSERSICVRETLRRLFFFCFQGFVGEVATLSAGKGGGWTDGWMDMKWCRREASWLVRCVVCWVREKSGISAYVFFRALCFRRDLFAVLVQSTSRALSIRSYVWGSVLAPNVFVRHVGSGWWSYRLVKIRNSRSGGLAWLFRLIYFCPRSLRKSTRSGGRFFIPPCLLACEFLVVNPLSTFSLVGRGAALRRLFSKCAAVGGWGCDRC